VRADDYRPGVTVLTVAYDGGPFAGFQRQDGLPTVQGRLEEALATALRRPVITVGAGRTDTGVHALGQTVSYAESADDPDPHTLSRSLNALAGPDIVVTGVRRASAEFDARHSALAREYRYRLVPGPVPPLFLADVAWWVKGALDLRAMREASKALIGEHDFRSFCVTASAEGKRTVRDIEAIAIEPDEELGEHCVTIRMVGRSFLHSMVRIVVGSLVEVGRGRQSEQWLAEVLTACERSAAGPTAPARGLTLWYVTYPEDCWL
jgi:tRNA pseudouridine38-40 synthase